MKKVICLYFLLLSAINVNAGSVPGYVPTNGLLAFWSFNANADNQAGNSLYHGVVYGATLTNDRFGNAQSAFSFDGNDKIEIGNVGLGDINTSYTYMAWFKTSSINTANKTIMSDYDSNTGDDINYACWNYLDANAAARSEIKNSPNVYGVTSSSGMNNDVWHQLITVIDRNSNTIKQYVDATFIGSTAMPSNINFNTNGFLRFGVHKWNNQFQTQSFWIGELDDIAIWDRVLSTQEITGLYTALQPSIPAYVPVSGLLAYYPYNGNANDATGNNFNGIVSRASSTTDRFNNPDRAFAFSAAQQSRIKGTKLDTVTKNTFTYNVWVNSDSLAVLPIQGNDGGDNKQIVIHPTHGYTWGWGNTTNAGAGLYVGTNGIYLIEHSDAYYKAPLVSQQSLIGWHMITIVYNNKLPSLYVDGIFVKNGVANTRNVRPSLGPDAQYGNAGIGNGGTGNSFFKGKIDDLALWNRVLTQQEISKLYNSVNITTKYVDKNSSSVIQNGTILNPYKTIQLAVNNANDGDTILINDGNYLENIEVYDKGLHFKSINGYNKVSIAPFNTTPNQNIYTIKFFTSWNTKNSSVEGITFKDNPSQAIRIKQRAFATIKNCYFTNNNLCLSTYYGHYNLVNSVFRKNERVIYNDVCDSSNSNNIYHCVFVETKYYLAFSNPNARNKIYNSILFNNNTSSSSLNDFGGNIGGTGIVIMRNSIFDGADVLTSKVNVINVNPNFADTNCINLKSSSPAIGFGSIAYANATDFYYRTRPQPINSNPDLGVAETIYDAPLILDTVNVKSIIDTLMFPNNLSISLNTTSYQKKNIIAYNFKLNYNSTKFKFDSVSTINTASAGGTLQVNSAVNGLVNIGWARTTKLTGSQPIINLFFSTIDSGKANFTLSNAYFNADSVTTVTPKSVVTKFNFGDIDLNKKILAYDAALALQYSVGMDPLPTMDPLPWEPWRIKIASVDTSIAVNANDASLILKYSVGVITKFPKRGISSAPGYVTVNLENNELVVRSFEDMGGLNITFLDHLSDLGAPTYVHNTNALSAFNKQANMYKIGVAFSEAPVNGTVILRIPYTGSGNQTLNMELVENTAARNYQLNVVTGINDIKNSNIKIYPNPTNNIINIEGLNKNENNTIQIFDVQGKLVITKTITEKGAIDLSELNKGVYVIKIGEVAQRIVKM